MLEVQPSARYFNTDDSNLPLLFAALIGGLTFLMVSALFALAARKTKYEALAEHDKTQLEKWAVQQRKQTEALAAQRNDQLMAASKQLQESELYAMQSEKMSSIGLMVAGVAHEINTPLGIVSSRVEILHELTNSLLVTIAKQEALMAKVPLLDSVASEERENWFDAAIASAKDLQDLHENGVMEDASNMVIESLSGLERINEIVSLLKNFSRVDRAQSGSVDLHHCIDTTLVIAHSVLKTKAAVVKQFGNLPTITCNPSQINQVILNLVSNAAQAMDYIGTITLTTTVDGDFVVPDVADTGPGMSDDVRKKIFEPFFSTKGPGEGTGLGLAICRKIITSHNGTLTVKSMLNVGTRFTIRLPIAGVGANADLAQINALSAHYLQTA